MKLLFLVLFVAGVCYVDAEQVHTYVNCHDWWPHSPYVVRKTAEGYNTVRRNIWKENIGIK